MPRILRTRTSLIIAVVLCLVAAYAAAGFLLAPKLLRSALLEQIPKQTGCVPSIGDIRINPFLLQLEARDFSIADRAGMRLVGFDRLFVRISAASIWHRAVEFKDIDIAGPFVAAVVASDGRLNLLQLAPKPAEPPRKTPAESQSLPRIRIDAFKVTGGSVSYEDRSRPSAFAARLTPVTFDLRDFTTDASGGMFSFTGATKLGERFDWRGHLSVQPVESDGEVHIQGLRARTIWNYVEDQVAFAIDSGSIDVDARYRFALRDTVDLKVDVAKIGVTDLGLAPKGETPDWIVVPSFVVAQASLDLSKRALRVDSATLTGLRVLAWLNGDKSINLARLAQPPGAPRRAGDAAASIAAAPAPAAAAGPWNFDLRELDVDRADISMEDRSLRPSDKVLLAPLSLRVEGISLDPGRPLKFKFDTKINQSGALAANGTVTREPLVADLQLALSNLDLKPLQPYLGQRTALTLLDGRTSADAKIHVGKSKPSLQVTANVSVENLRTVDDRLHKDFVDWQRLDVLGIKLQQDPDRLSIDRIVARKPYARVIIEPDRSLNATQILAGPTGTAALAPATPAGIGAAQAGAPRSGASKIAPGKAIAAKAGSSMPFPISIRSVEIESGETDFADLSVSPNFAAGIQKLHGTVRGLATQADSRALVDLHGQVDPFAPVAITGALNVLGPVLHVDLALDFQNIELSIFNPYSGKFAGYNVTKGKLTTDLSYKVDGRALDAKHHVKIDQLEFGEKTDSKAAVSLPIKLAVALLKDRNGVIELDVPVSGSLDDPKFSVWPVVWHFVGTLLIKAVTAPFALLGSLFGGGPDLQFIDFHPGAAALDPASGDKIKSIVSALKARPQLKLEVPIAAVPEIDRPALVQAKFLSDVHAEQSAAPPRKEGAPADLSKYPPLDQLDAQTRLNLLTRLYIKKAGHPPEFPIVDGKQPKADLTAAKIAYLQGELIARTAVTDEELAALAQQRAQALQQALLADTGVDPARVFLVASDKAKAQEGLVRLELSLQ